MEKAEARKIVTECLPMLRWAHGMQEWCLTVEYDASLGATLGQSTYRRRYKEGEITLNYERIEDKRHLLEILDHEIWHAKIDAFALYMNAVRPFMTQAEAESSDHVFQHAADTAVTEIQSMLYGQLGMNPEAIIAMAKAHLEKWKADSTIGLDGIEKEAEGENDG